MGSYKKSKVKSSSLLESVLSITIISIVIVVVMIIFSNLFLSENKQKDNFFLLNKIDEIRLEYLNNKIINDNVLEYKGYTIISVVERSEFPKVWLSITVKRKEQIVLKKEYYIKTNKHV